MTVWKKTQDLSLVLIVRVRCLKEVRIFGKANKVTEKVTQI